MKATAGLAGRPVTLRARWVDTAGEGAADPAAATVTVTAADGRILVPAGTPAAVDGAERSITIPAVSVPTVDRLTATWVSATEGVVITTHDLVGGWYVELDEVRELPGLADTAKYTTAELTGARAWAETVVEEVCGVAFTPRYGAETVALPSPWHHWSWRNTFLLRPRVRRILSVAAGGVAADLTGWVLGHHGSLRVPGSFPADVVTVGYEHGHDRPPEDLRQAVLSLIKYRLTSASSREFDRATAINTDAGTVQLLTASTGRPTGIPDVDVVLHRHTERVPGLA